MRIMLFIFLLHLVFASTFCSSQPKPDTWHSRIKQDSATSEGYMRDFNFGPPWSRDTAFHILLNTELFASSAVSIDGAPSEQSLAFCMVLQQEDAEDAFLDLYERGYTAGKLYALCGLRLLDSVMFAEKAKPLIAGNDTAFLFEGCLMGIPVPVTEMIYSSDGIRYNRPIGMAIVDSVFANSRLRIPWDSGTAGDIVGGGWPLNLVRAGRVVEADPDDE